MLFSVLWQGERQDNSCEKCDGSSVGFLMRLNSAWLLLFQLESIEHRSFLFLLGRKLGYTFNNRNFHNVSLGQGQEVVAEQALDVAAAEGHWVILQVLLSIWKQAGRSASVLTELTQLSVLSSDGTRHYLCFQITGFCLFLAVIFCFLSVFVILVLLLCEPSAGCAVVRRAGKGDGATFACASVCSINM